MQEEGEGGGPKEGSCIRLLVPGLVEQTGIMGVPGSGFGQPEPWLGRTPVGAFPPARSSMGAERGDAVRFGLSALVLSELVLGAKIRVWSQHVAARELHRQGKFLAAAAECDAMIILSDKANAGMFDVEGALILSWRHLLVLSMP